MISVLRHELTMYYHSMKAYFFGAFLLAFTGIGALIYNINQSIANFEYVLNFISIVFVVLVPILTMRVIADEKRQKTDMLLYSLPISTTDIVVGKFLALAVVYLIPTVIICLYPLLFKRFGDVYLPASYGTICAFYFLGLSLMSIGMFISCLTESQGVAAGITVVAMIFLYFSSTLANYISSTAVGSVIGLAVLIVIAAVLVRVLTKSDFAGIFTGVIGAAAVAIVYFVNSSLLEGLLPTVMSAISPYSRFNTFVNGVFDVTGLVYYLSVIVFFLFLCVQALEKRRYNG